MCVCVCERERECAFEKKWESLLLKMRQCTYKHPKKDEREDLRAISLSY